VTDRPGPPEAMASVGPMAPVEAGAPLVGAMPAARRRRPVAMLAHSYYEEDPRVRREAESLVAAGRPVHVYALRRPGDGPDDHIEGVALHRIDVQRHQGAGIATYLREYLSFFARAGWAASRDHRRRRYGLLQVHTLPDFLAFAGVPLRLAGVPLLLDLHEAMPEFFRIRFPRASGRLAHAGLVAQERASIAVADAVLTVNEALRERLIRLGVAPGKVTVILNSPSLARFDRRAHPDRPFAADGTVRLVYAGALSPVYELDVALEAVRRLGERRPGLAVHLDLYGRDFAEVPLADRAAGLGLGDRVTLHGRIPIEAVPAALAAADIGLAPTRRSEMTDFSLSTKVFEYAAMGKPVVASRLPMVERTFPPGTVVTYEPGDPDSLVDAVLGLVDDAETRTARVARTLALVGALSWEREAVRYRAVVDRLAPQ
jgi:glycosyltransferase involved in cell wall biosynthesis